MTAWASKVPAGSLYLSVITLLELEMGFLLVERRDAAQGTIMRTWLDGHVLPAFAGQAGFMVRSACGSRQMKTNEMNPSG